MRPTFCGIGAPGSAEMRQSEPYMQAALDGAPSDEELAVLEFLQQANARLRERRY